MEPLFLKKLDWEAHITELVTKASKGLFYLCQLKWSGLSEGKLLTAYKALIQPVVCVPYVDVISHHWWYQSPGVHPKEGAWNHHPLYDLWWCSRPPQTANVRRAQDTLCRELVNATTADTQHKLHGLMPTKRESGYGRSIPSPSYPHSASKRVWSISDYLTTSNTYIIKDLFSIMPYNKLFILYI